MSLVPTLSDHQSGNGNSRNLVVKSCGGTYLYIYEANSFSYDPFNWEWLNVVTTIKNNEIFFPRNIWFLNEGFRSTYILIFCVEGVGSCL